MVLHGKFSFSQKTHSFSEKGALKNMLANVIVILSRLITINAYYLSLNTFEYQQAENYCIQHCGSHLVSLHSINDYNRLKNLVINVTSDPLMNIGDEITTYIGLNDRETAGKFVWTDGSKLDFLNDTSGNGTYPWGLNEPGSSDCIIMHGIDKNGDYLLNDKQCKNDEGESDVNIFACNHCNGKLTKYVILDDDVASQKKQRLACEHFYGTGLASLHTNDDALDTHKLCNISASQKTQPKYKSRKNCYIGLYNDNGTGNFQWEDGSTFDFGSDISGGVYPWDSDDNEPDGTGLCTNLKYVKDFAWADGNCDTSRKAICSMPSEVCYLNEWSIIDGNNGNWTVRPCQLSIPFNESNTMIMGNKRWYNGDKPLVIEYMYTINDVDSGSNGGIILKSSPLCDHYYSIGINPSISTVFVADVLNGNYDIMYSEPLGFVHQMGIFYLLRVELSNDGIATIYVNDNMLITADNIGDGSSPYIGIRNVDSSIIAKSLFVSGSVIYEYNEESDIRSWFEICTETLTASIQTTLNPSNSPSTIPTTNPFTLLTTGYNTKNKNESNNMFYYILCGFVVLLFICCLFLGVTISRKIQKQRKSEKNMNTDSTNPMEIIEHRGAQHEMTGVQSDTDLSDLMDEGTDTMNLNDAHSGHINEIPENVVVNDEIIIDGDDDFDQTVGGKVLYRNSLILSFNHCIIYI